MAATALMARLRRRRELPSAQHRLVFVDRRTGVEEHPLASKSLIEPGATHDFQNPRVEPDQPDGCTTFGRASTLIVTFR